MLCSIVYYFCAKMDARCSEYYTSIKTGVELGAGQALICPVLYKGSHGSMEEGVPATVNLCLLYLLTRVFVNIISIVALVEINLFFGPFKRISLEYLELQSFANN